MLKTQLDYVKQRLLGERRLVVAALQRNRQQVLAETDDSTRDLGDLASASHDKELLFRLQESETARLETIDQVLSDIEHGHYGACQQCGKAIGQTRLDALPWATHCRPCQDVVDLRETSFRRSDVAEPRAKRQHDAA